MFESNDGMSSSESYGGFSQFGDSLKGMLTGFVLFPLSLFIIFKVETCQQAGDVLQKAVPVAEAKDGQPAYVTGKLQAEPLASRFIKKGKYIIVSNSTEIFAPYEQERTEGKGTDKRKFRRCKYKWMKSLKDPAVFKLSGCKRERERIRRDTLLYPDATAYAKNAKVVAGGKTYQVNLKDVKLTSGVSRQEPDADALIAGTLTKAGKYLYTLPRCSEKGDEKLLLGCERVEVRVTPIPSGEMTFIGNIKGGAISPFTSNKGNKFLSAGIGTFKQTMGEVKSDDATMKRVGYFICFMMVWVSFMLLTGPLTTLVDFIPFVGEMGKAGINILLGVVAFVITAVTILIVKLWWLWILLFIGGIGYGIYKRKSQTA